MTMRALEPAQSVDQPAVDFEHLGANRVLDPQRVWVMLLELMPHCNVSRVVYCYVLKRWLDVVVALILLILLLPLLLTVACVLRLAGGGPVLFKQKRIGRNGKAFIIYKFRTMRVDGEAVQLHIVDGKSHKVPNDPRVTRLGKFLRQTSIDELPQLFNILKGDMSFVGPRPELPEIVSKYEEWQHERHLVTPGLTGWWQVEGRGKQPMHQFTHLDIYYVENQSFSLDMHILLRTVRVVLARTGAF